MALTKWLIIGYFHIVFSSTSISSISSYDLQGKRFDDVCCKIDVSGLIDQLGWSSVAYVHDNEHVVISKDVHVIHGKQQRYNIEHVNLGSVLGQMYQSLSPDVNIVISVRDTKLPSILRTIDEYDSSVNRSTDFRHNSKILVGPVTNLSHISHVINHLENVAMLVTQTEPCDEVTLHTLRRGRDFVPVSLSSDSELNNFFPNLRYGYNNRRLLLAAIENFMAFKEHLQDGTSRWIGFQVDIWNIIAAQLNFSFDIIEPEDQMYGTFHNGEWDGIVRQLLMNEVDASLAFLSITHQRSLYIDFVMSSTTADKADILYQTPKVSNTYRFLLAPFKTEVYLYLALTYVVVIIILTLAEYCLLVPQPNTTIVNMLYRLLNVGQNLTGAICKQDVTMEVKSASGKVLLSSWCLLVMVITSVYCANLMAALSSPRATKLTTIDQLLDNGYSIGMPTWGSTYSNLKSSTLPELKRLFSIMTERSKDDSSIFLNNKSEQVARVKQGGMAYFMRESDASYYMADDCELTLLGFAHSWAGDDVAIPLPKGSPLLPDIEIVMQGLQNAGIVDLLKHKWTPKSNCTDPASAEAKAISLREVTGAFLLSCVGLGLSVPGLVCEILYNKMFLD